MKKIYYLILGFILIIIDFPITTNVQYNIVSAMGEVTERDFWGRLFVYFEGTNLRIDILPDIIGYFLIGIVALCYLKVHKRFTHIACSGAIGVICSVAGVILPFTNASAKSVIGGILVCRGLDYFVVILIAYSLARAVYAQVDGYMHLEMWKEFKLDWNIMVVAMPVIYVVLLMGLGGIPWMNLLAVVIYGVWMYAAIHFTYRAHLCIKKLGLFGKGESHEG